MVALHTTYSSPAAHTFSLKSRVDIRAAILAYVNAEPQLPNEKIFTGLQENLQVESLFNFICSKAGLHYFASYMVLLQ